MTLLERLKGQAHALKVEVYALWLAYRDPRVPWHARLFAAAVVAYAFSPLDLIPDPIPVLGYLDDLILVPLGIRLALAMIPAQVMAESREKAKDVMRQGHPEGRVAAAVIVLIWIVAAGLVSAWLWRLWRR